MDNSKKWFYSITVIGGIVALVASTSGLAITFDPSTGDFSGNLFDLGTQLGSILGSLVAIIGRFKAKATLTK